jgi:hypothetical protein
MPTEYIANLGLSAQVEAMIMDTSLSELGPLRTSGLKIGACFKSKLVDGEAKPAGAPIDLKKFPTLWKLFAQPTEEYEYVLVIDQYAWDSASQTAQKAFIHKGLMSIEITEGGSKTRKPDVMEFSQTVKRFGPYSQTLEDLLDRGTREAAAVTMQVMSGARRRPRSGEDTRAILADEEQ